MFLNNLKLRNFRSFDDGEIELQRNLTIFVGENNGGKSNAIDAIRLLTRPLGDRREIYCETTDVRFGTTTGGFELEASYSDLTPGQQGRLISAASDQSLSQATFGLRYDGQIGSRPSLWAGKFGNSPEPGSHDMIRHVYLPPLRDAKRALASGNPTRVLALLNHFRGQTGAAELAKQLARRPEHDVLTKVDDAVAKGLSNLTGGTRPQNASLGFADHEGLIDIARDLRFKLADAGIIPEDLAYSGLGYANLLFMATIAVELENVRKSDLTVFLVEEPEAHLHPQLQAAVLGFLNDQASNSKKAAQAEGPAGEIQVVVATHSPNLSAWVSSKQLVVFKSLTISPSAPPNLDTAPSSPAAADEAVIENAIAEGVHDETSASVEGLTATIAAAAIRRSTRCIPLARLNLPDPDRRKVDRYLDVTKSSLLFGGRVLLVEGIAEALLLPVIAEKVVLKDHADKLRLFRSTVFVPIDGVDFKPYVNLLTAPHNGARIAERVVVMTDGDKGKNKKSAEDPDASEADDDATDEDTDIEADTDAEDGNGTAEVTLIPGERRRKQLLKLAADNSATDCVSAISSTYTLETELIIAKNGDLLRRVYLAHHPKSAVKWDNAVALEGDELAKAMDKIFKGARKGDFAQTLAALIEDGEKFFVPDYISAAIKEVVGGI